MFFNPPVLTISFENQHDLLGLTFTFDTFSGDYASEILVTAYNREEITDQFTAFADNSEYAMEHPFQNCTKLEIHGF